jgi:hypothetical protein
MNNQIFIELRNGEQFEAEWAKPFVPADKEVVIFLANSKEKRLFSLSRISCILMAETAARRSAGESRMYYWPGLQCPQPDKPPTSRGVFRHSPRRQ